MTAMLEDQSKTAPGSLALIQAFVNTQYGQGKHAHIELASPEQLRAWLVAHSLLADGSPVMEGDFRRVLQLREALRALLRANIGVAVPASQIEELNYLANNAPLTVRFHQNGSTTLEPDIAGVDGAIAQLLSIMFTAMRDGTWIRLKVCRNERCQKAFYDTSRNQSGAWCSMAECGSLFKARAYRQRSTTHLER